MPTITVTGLKTLSSHRKPVWPSERASCDALQWQQRVFEITGGWKKGSFWPAPKGFGQPWKSPQLAAGGGMVGGVLSFGSS